MSAAYDFHIFICQNHRLNDPKRGCCFSKGSGDLLDYMRKRLKELGVVNQIVIKSGCMNQCKKGPIMVIYPEGTWYTPKSVEDIEEIIQSHLLKNRKISRLLME